MHASAADDDSRADTWLPAREAAALLGVSLPTLYSYASRGLLHPLPQPGSRAKRYRLREVQRLARRHATVRQPREVAGATLDFGLPVLASGLCLIEHGRLSYRGQDAIALAGHATLEDAAALLWRGGGRIVRAEPPPLPNHVGRALRDGAAAPMPQRLLHGYALLSHAWSLQARDADDPTAWHCVQAMLVAATGRPPAPSQAPLHRQLQAAWDLPAASTDLLRRALVLCADHESNASSFTARCVASTGAAPAHAVAAALAALSGPRHGGMSEDVESLWDAALAAAADDASLAHWLHAHPTLPGFGHRLYPAGDPRAAHLLAQLPPDPRLARLVDAVQASGGLRPNLDLSLVAVRRALGAPRGAAFALFAIGRTVGWLAHAFEQQRDGSLIRPRTAYVGPRPE